MNGPLAVGSKRVELGQNNETDYAVRIPKPVQTKIFLEEYAVRSILGRPAICHCRYDDAGLLEAGGAVGDHAAVDAVVALASALAEELGGLEKHQKNSCIAVAYDVGGT